MATATNPEKGDYAQYVSETGYCTARPERLCRIRSEQFAHVPPLLDFFQDMKTAMCLSLLETQVTTSSIGTETLEPHHRRYLQKRKSHMHVGSYQAA